METIEEEGVGAVAYLIQEGRGIGLMNKIRAYKLQEQGVDTVDANVRLGFRPDEREYDVCAEMMRSVGITKIKLVSNNPAKQHAMETLGIEVVQNVSIELDPHENNSFYMQTKRERMGHVLLKS